MRVHNVRLGFANNSSSSHSIIIWDKGLPLPSDDACVDDQGFGWECFTLTTRETKLGYLGQLLLGNLRTVLRDDGQAQKMAASWSGVDIDAGGYVDHQSMYDLPRVWSPDIKGIDPDFFIDFKKFVEREDVVILGGNDNSDYHPLHGMGSEVALALPQDVGVGLNTVCRRDGSYWTVFSRDTGAKFRISFTPDSPTPTKSSYPELVDVKVTDHCPFGCDYCYQGSTPSGGHAQLEDIDALASTCASARVFEVALGGGEPTMHPNFLEILDLFRSRGVVPNFTTRNLTWLQSAAMADALPLMGSFAFSVDTIDDVERLKAVIVRNRTLIGKCSVQYVIGASDDAQFEGILRTCGLIPGVPLTLLGWKDTGRGQDAKTRRMGLERRKQRDWVSTLEEFLSQGPCPRVSVDTVLAASSHEALRASGIPSWMYSVRDGAFSMYVDAVNHTLGPSSYCDASEMFDVSPEFTSDEMWRAYASF